MKRTAGYNKGAKVVFDVIDFNEQYLFAIVNRSSGNKKLAVQTLYAEPEQIDALIQSAKDTIKAMSSAPVAVVEPTFKMEHLKRRREDLKSEDSIVARLNYNFLLMVRNLSSKNVRLAYLATQTPLQLCETIKGMTAQELEQVAHANNLMFKCALSPKSIIKANSRSLHLSGDKGFLKHLAILTMGVSEGARA